MPPLRVLVVGASIAGPTAAYWFARAGAKVTVIERFPHLRTNGQNIDIRTVGVTVMRKMPGMEEAVRAKTIPLKCIAAVRSDGRPFGVISTTGNPDQQSLVSEFEIYRGDLSQILYDRTHAHPNITYIFGEQVASIQQHDQADGPVKVEFASGSPTMEFDLVVSCDGATSRTRAIGLGVGMRDYLEPTGTWAAFFSAKQDLLDGNNKMGKAYNAVGGRIIAAGPDPSGVSRVVLMKRYAQKDSSATQPFRDAMNQGGDALRQFVAQTYRGAGWKCDEVIKDMMEAEDFYASEIVHVKVPRLSKGRFVLVGDAGYAASTGTGTSLAMAGAYVLAGEVCKHKGDLAGALQGYEDVMRPLIDDMQKVPPLLPVFFTPQTAWGLWLRNMVFAFVCWSGILSLTQKFFSGAFAGTERYQLPQYEWQE
ncbi:putative FAD-binding monooxygenase [Aspergillus saccharolyticus JOP 1030-1]|uniref:Oxidoreductase n=1 Tax=Aspergillus saccharolyticus JOP 1030-1 TaxID=1450539 RepID=A0A318ZEN0_9EURO|nr:oxidoreductase [Aspergillus saccharolyticus JOP 1030-1]PYH43083.1 oxidoreductase [Aspergillus saccharolyticus JOP 1030-1]